MDVTMQRRWLRIGAGLVMASGLLVALMAHPATGAGTAVLVDLLVWPLDGAETGAAAETRLLAAIGGGVMAGWGWMLWRLAGAPLEAMPAEVRRLVVGSTALWFVVDSAGSLAAGAPLNLAGNLVFLALLTVPFLRPARPALA